MTQYEDIDVHVKQEITRGNLWSILATMVSLGTILVTLTLAYAALSTKNDLQDAEITRLKSDIAKIELATANVARDIGGIQGDIRVIRQIIEARREQTQH